MDNSEIINKTMFRYPNRAKQLIAFDGLEFGKIHPTDIDAIIEYKDKAWVLFEVKTGAKELNENNGQRILMNRFYSNLPHGKHVLCLVCEHNVMNEQEPVYLSECNVRELLGDSGKWRKPKHPITAGDAVKQFIQWVDTH